MLRVSSSSELNSLRASSIAQVNVRPVSAGHHSPATATSPSQPSNGAPVFAFGISPRWHVQLALLGVSLACCGGVVGLSRLLPQLAEAHFREHSHSSVLLMIVTFGVLKAVFNLLVGALANAYGRRSLLLVGWCLSFGTPLLIWLALECGLSWRWVLFATALLGASQGLVTSTVVVMVMDIVPTRTRGLSMGALECIIYVSLGLCALVASEVYAAFADFRFVLLVHAALCICGSLAALRTKETQAMALDVKAADDDLQVSGDTLGFYRDEQQEPQEEAFSSSFAEAQPPHGWHLVEEADMEAPSSLGLGLARSPGRKANLSLTMTSILPTLALHTIPASPLETPLDSAPPTPLALPMPGMLRSHSAGALTSTHLQLPQQAASVGCPSPKGSPTLPPIDPSPPSSPPTLAMHGSSATAPLLGVVPLSSSLPPLTLGPATTSSASLSVSTAAGTDASFLSVLRLSATRVCSSRVLRALLQAGFTNNFRDGVLWGLLPHFFLAHRALTSQVGYLLTAYPMVWGLGQLVTGQLSDRLGRAAFISGGLALQGLAVLGLLLAPASVSLVLFDVEPEEELMAEQLRFVVWLVMLATLGLGTALSYPVLQAYIGDHVAAVDRASTIGVYRLCRDLGYAVGGLLSGVMADRYGVETALAFLAAILLGSAAWAHSALPLDAATTRRIRKEAR